MLRSLRLGRSLVRLGSAAALAGGCAIGGSAACLSWGGGGSSTDSEESKELHALGHLIGNQLTDLRCFTPAELDVLLTGLRASLLGEGSSVPLDTYAPKASLVLRDRVQAHKAAEAKRNSAQNEAGLKAAAGLDGAKPCGKQGRYGAQAADWPRLAEAPGSLRHDLALKEASGEPASRGLSHLVLHIGARRTTSGLVYHELRRGTGAAPTATSTVKVHYVGSLLDGTEFDSSIKRGQPAEFALDSVLPGWSEGVQLMRVGGKARLHVPSELGYGDRGVGPIPPGSVLVFELELVDVVTQ
jgi:hypothetical protein